MIDEKNVFRKREQTSQLLQEHRKVGQCTGCNQPLGIVSTMLYEIDEELYCSDCYSRMISNKAAIRDHSDLMQ